MTINSFTDGNIIGNVEKGIDSTQIEATKTSIELAITKVKTINDGEVEIEDIINQLEKDKIINVGDSNPDNGQVKTQPDGYIYEIKEKEKGDWEVIYIGKGEIELNDLIITATPNTTGIASQVTITITGKSKDNITQYIDGLGTTKTYTSATKQITETYTATQNGTYTFTLKDSDGTTKTATVEINNIITGDIQISANPTTPTTGNVVVTVVWPSGSERGIKEIKIGEGDWKTVTGSSHEITVKENCTVKARGKNSINEIKSATLTIDNIDKNNPIVTATAGIEEIEIGTSNDISNYFTIEENGTAKITKVEYIDISNENEAVTNTNTLAVGTHEITCTATKATGATASATKKIVVTKVKGVYGSVYKISDEEYHLVFNSTGELAEGYTEEQVILYGDNIIDGNYGNYKQRITYKYGNSGSTFSIATQPWGEYAELIKEVIITEKIYPKSLANYFQGLTSLETIINISNINTELTTDMRGMFGYCYSLTSLDLSNWDTSNVTNMGNMFNACSELKSLDLSNWDTSNVTNMSDMFYTCSRLTSLDLSSFDTGNVTSMDSMFERCDCLTSLNLSNFDTRNVTSMYGIFKDCKGLTSLDLSNFNTTNVTRMHYMFYNCSELTNLDLSDFNTSNVTTMANMFWGCSKLTTLDLSNFNTSSVSSSEGAHSSWVEGFESMFSGCTGLTSLDISNFDTSNVADFNSMFSGCGSLISLELCNFDTGKAKYMNDMFSGCKGLTSLDISDFDTSNVTNMLNMFSGCTGLTSLDISKFDTSNVTNMSSMFSGCSGFTSLDISKFDTSNVTSMYGMFQNCTGLKSLDISNFDTRNVISMTFMFYGCIGLTSLDISNFDTSCVTRMEHMFARCGELKTIYVSDLWSTAAVTKSNSMFYACNKLIGKIAYNSSKIDANYANYNDGYLTYKESE